MATTDECNHGMDNDKRHEKKEDCICLLLLQWVVAAHHGWLRTMQSIAHEDKWPNVLQYHTGTIVGTVIPIAVVDDRTDHDLHIVFRHDRATAVRQET